MVFCSSVQSSRYYLLYNKPPAFHLQNVIFPHNLFTPMFWKYNFHVLFLNIFRFVSFGVYSASPMSFCYSFSITRTLRNVAKARNVLLQSVTALVYIKRLTRLGFIGTLVPLTNNFPRYHLTAPASYHCVWILLCVTWWTLGL